MALFLSGIGFTWLGSLSNQSSEIAHQQAESRPVIRGLSDDIPRLAVLAFTALGSSENHDFARGFISELNSRLAGLTNLAVVAHASSSRYNAETGSLIEMGNELGADYLLHGDIRWGTDDAGGTSIRVTPNMISVADDTLQWSTTIDRHFDDSLSIQTEIAAEVVKSLNIEMSASEVSALAERPTENALAYEIFLKGVNRLPDGSHAPEEEYRQARALFTQALELDPEFALAWTKRAESDLGIYWYGYDVTPTRLKHALEAIDTAERIDTDLPEVAIMRGDYNYRLRNYPAAMNAYSKIFQHRPNDVRIIRNLGYLWRREGMFELALEQQEKASALDPLTHKLELAWTHLILNNFDRSLELIEESKRTDPDDEWVYLMGTIFYWTRGRDGDLDYAAQYLDAFPDPRSNYPAWFKIMQKLYEGDPEAALAIIDKMSEPAFVLQAQYMPKQLAAGLTLKYMGEEDRALAQLNEAMTILQQKYEENPDDFRFPLSLGMAYAGLGMTDQAISEARSGLKLMPIDHDALIGTTVMYQAMQIYAIAGEDELALDVLADLLSIPSRYSGIWFTHNPAFSSLWGQDRFRNLMAE
jgi:tetratricopeptide (TPR) repeat protein